MADMELLNIEERKNKIRKLTGDLSSRFNELLWNDEKKKEKLKRMKPTVMEELWKKEDELDKRCLEYLEGKIDWEGDSLQMEFMPVTKQPFPRLEIDRDVENYAREMYCWMALQVKDL